MQKTKFQTVALSGIVFILLGNSCSSLPKQLVYQHEDTKQNQTEQAGTGVKGELKQNEPGYAQKVITAKRGELPGVVTEERWKNALSKSYRQPYNKVFEAVLESMLYLPVEAVDKSAGIITTGWTRKQDFNKDTLGSINVFGDGVRLVRYRYSVRIYDRGEETIIKVIPFAQVTKNRRWIDGNPSVVISEKLMQKIILEME